MDKCGVLVTVPNSSPELLATLPLTGRGNECQGCSEAPSLSSILTSDDTTQHSCSPDSNLSANQALPAPPPILFHSLPSTAQTGLPARPWVIDQEHLVTTRTCPGSLGEQDLPHQSSWSLLTTKEEMRPAVTVLVPRSLGSGPSVSRAKHPYVCGKRWLKPLGCSPLKIAPQSFPQGVPLFLKGDGGPPLPSLSGLESSDLFLEVAKERHSLLMVPGPGIYTQFF